QGDEPELDAEATAELVRGMREDPGLLMATLAHREADPRSLAAPDVVKVGVDAAGFALYFSRMHPAPGAMGVEALRHIGVYGFRRRLILEFAAWPSGRLEQAERLEQLRALERGVRIRVFASRQPGMGVDTPEQLARLERRRRHPRAERAPGRKRKGADDAEDRGGGRRGRLVARRGGRRGVAR